MARNAFSESISGGISGGIPGETPKKLKKKYVIPEKKSRQKSTGNSDNIPGLLFYYFTNQITE